MLHGHEVSKDIGLYYAACTVDSRDDTINYEEFSQANHNKTGGIALTLAGKGRDVKIFLQLHVIFI